MRRTLALASLCIVTALLAGCVSYGGGYSSGPPPPSWGWYGGDGWGEAFAAMFLMILLVVVIAIVAIVALGVTALSARGPAAQVAGALLLVLGAWVLLASFGDPSLLGMAIGLGMVALGIAALMQGQPQAAAAPAPGRSIVTEERR